MADVASSLVAGLLPLVGAGLGAVTTLAVQRSSARASRLQHVLEVEAARRSEIKSAVIAYFELAQHLQGKLDARERGESPSELKTLIERVWLAEKQVEIIATEDLRDRIIAHAEALHTVVRNPLEYSDWWAHCSDLQAALLTQIKRDLDIASDARRTVL